MEKKHKEIQIDCIPIYKNEILPTKDMWFHFIESIPVDYDEESSKNKIIQVIMYNEVCWNADAVILVSNGKVIEVKTNFKM